MSKVWKFSALLLVLTGILSAEARLVVSLAFNRRRYMIYEQIYACITIRNDSGKPLLFGERPELTGFILFDIRNSNQRLLPKRKNVEIPTYGLMIAPGEIKRMIVPLLDYYDLSKPDIYSIHAYVGHNQLKHEYRSQDLLVTVSSGASVWTKTVGLPNTGNSRTPSGTERTYSIYRMDGDRDKYYYLRVEDDGKIFAVTRIGTYLTFMDYSVHVDMLSRIHLLMPVGPRVYHYLVFNADGMNMENSYWKTHGTEPMLYRDPKTGKVIRMGGTRARAGVDYADPNTGKISVSELLKQNDRPVPRKDSGLVDLGAGIMPEKAADED